MLSNKKFRFYHIIKFFNLLSLFIFTVFLSFSTHSQEKKEAPLPDLFHAEIFLYEGLQYFHVMTTYGHHKVFGEKELIHVNETTQPMDLYSIPRSTEHKYKVPMISATKDENNQLFFHLNLTQAYEEKIIFQCDFKSIYKEGLYWLTGEHECSHKGVRINIENDNEDI